MKNIVLTSNSKRMLRYKEHILPTVARFFRHKNDVDIYIEDKNDDEFYLALFQRIATKSGVTIGKLISLGDRQTVINTCLADQKDRNRKRIYVIDGDLHLINGSNPSEIKFLHIHDAYCIENYLIDEDAIIEILHDGFVISKEEISKLFTFDNFLKRLSKPLVELFLHYAIVFEICPTVKTVSNGVGIFCNQVRKVTVLADDKVNNKIAELKVEILKHIEEEEYNERIYALRQKWNYDTDTLLKIVSAKDYLLPLIQLRFAKIKSNTGFKITRESLRLRLAKLCSLDRLSSLETSLKK